MRIAYIVHDYHRTGGHSRYVAELATRFAPDHDVHVFANRIQPDKNAGIHFHRVPAWRATSLSTVLSFALPATVMPRGFDIVHGQGFCCWGANILTTHMCSRAWDLACRQMEGRLSVYHSLFNNLTSWLEHGIYKHTKRARVIAISKMVAGDVQRHYSCTLPTDVIYHGVDLAAFSPESRGIYRDKLRERLAVGDEFVFLYAGDLRKGARQCIAALRGVPDGRLVFVSRSPVADYRRLAEDMGVAERVRFEGPTDQIQAYYAASDCFLLPTPYDTFAMVALEAMASGLPVIVSRTAGASELVVEGETGFVLPDARDSDRLGELMRTLAINPERAQRMGREGRRVAESHSWDAVSRRTMEVYRALLGSAF